MKCEKMHQYGCDERDERIRLGKEVEISKERIIRLEKHIEELIQGKYEVSRDVGDIW